MAGAPAVRRSICTTHCGNIGIPYPFGVEHGCYHHGGFNLTCDHSHNPPQLYLGDGTVQVLAIDLPNGMVRVNVSTSGLDTNEVNGTWRAGGPGYAADGPYFLAEGRNNLVALGCNVQVLLLRQDGALVSSCSPFCLRANTIQSFRICSGIGCCQATILEGRPSYKLQFLEVGIGYPISLDPYQVLIVESDYSFNITEYLDDAYGYTVPAMLAWAITNSVCHTNGSSPSCRSKHSFCQNYTTVFGSDEVISIDVPTDSPDPDEASSIDYHGPADYHSHGHNCRCSGGYQGNPYISHGCYDINECDYPEIYPCYGDCRNTRRGYDCKCPLGFKGNASKKNGCEDIDECKHPEAYPCYGICINMPGTFHCRCHDGTHGDPFIKQGCLSFKTTAIFTVLQIRVRVQLSIERVTRFL
ncbi:hypothetical protein ACQ4PT_001393 [Festuca glaucescens]